MENNQVVEISLVEKNCATVVGRKSVWRMTVSQGGILICQRQGEDVPSAGQRRYTTECRSDYYCENNLNR